MMTRASDQWSQESKAAFEKAFQAAATKEQLMQLRLGLEEEAARMKSELAVAKRTAYRQGRYLAAEDFARLERNAKILGLRVQRIQNRLSTLRIERHEARERARREAADATGARAAAYYQRFHALARVLLAPDVYAQIAESADGRPDGTP
jgi:hypothetical protein